MQQDGPSSALSMLPAGGSRSSAFVAGARGHAHCPTCPRTGRKPRQGGPAVPTIGTAREPKAKQKAVHPSGSNAPSAAGSGGVPLPKRRRPKKSSRSQGGAAGSQLPSFSASGAVSLPLTTESPGMAVTHTRPSQHQLASVILVSDEDDGAPGDDRLGRPHHHRKLNAATAAYWKRKETEERGQWERLHEQHAELIQELGCFRTNTEHQLQTLRETCIEILAELRIRPEASSPCPYPSADPVQAVTEGPPVTGGSDLMDLEPVRPDSTTDDEPSAASITV